MFRRLKRIFIPVVIITLVIISMFVLSARVLENTYRTAVNREIANILGAVAEADPEIDTATIVRALRQPDSATAAAGREILESYGYLPSDLAAPSAKTFLSQMLGLVVGSILLFALIILGYFWYRDWAEERKVQRLVTYLQDLKDRIYDLKLEENSEDELSFLTNEIYKITVLLKESAENNQLHSRNLETALADISHQLRTPLTSLQVTIDNIYDDPEMPLSVRQDFLRGAIRQIESMSSLVMTLLNLAKFDNGSIKLYSQPVQVGELLTEVRQNLAVLSELQGVSVELTGDLDTEVSFDRRWQREALSNIIKNCIEHSQPGDNVKISVENGPLFLKITIADQGEGITEKDLHHIFERFYKAQNSSNDSVGIGLAFAKTVIEADNGQISVKSQPGVGTVFTVKYLK